MPAPPSKHLWRLPDRTLELAARPLVMGIVNVTPDSFSDGGQHATCDTAVAHALQLVEQGADLLDIGGESTRPGALPVALAEELDRVVPVVAELAKRTRVPLSIDTSKAAVAQACLDSGAHIINDITALTGDPAMPEVAVRTRAGVILMHMQGTPTTMQLAPRYEDVVREVRAYLQARLDSLTAVGIMPEGVVLDPGIGFGKTREHNLALLARLGELQALGRPVCLGVSRKGFLGKMLDRPLAARLAGSLAAACFGVAAGAAQVLRVHDVAETRDAMILWYAMTAYLTQHTTEDAAR